MTIACGGCAGDAGQLGMHDKISRSLAVGEHRVRTKGHTLLFGDGRPGMKCVTVIKSLTIMDIKVCDNLTDRELPDDIGTQMVFMSQREGRPDHFL